MVKLRAVTALFEQCRSKPDDPFRPKEKCNSAARLHGAAVVLYFEGWTPFLKQNSRIETASIRPEDSRSVCTFSGTATALRTGPRGTRRRPVRGVEEA